MELKQTLKNLTGQGQSAVERFVKRSSEFRRNIFWKLHLLSGRREGEVTCRWVRILWCIARPITMVEMLAARVINPMSCIVKIGNMRFTMEVFRMFDTSPTPGPWFRIIKRADGVITVEQRHDA